jgi:hypothetical protein
MVSKQRDRSRRRQVRRKGDSNFWKFWMTPVEGGSVTDAARNHD